MDKKENQERKSKWTLFDELGSGLGQITIENKDAFNSNTKRTAEPMWDDVEKELISNPEEERLCYITWYAGPLAGRGWFAVVNKFGEIINQKQDWIS